MERLTVELAERSYPIYIGSGLLSKPELLTPAIRRQHVFVVTNTTLAPLYLDQLLASLEGYQVNQVILPDGEQYKDMATLEQIFSGLLEHRHGRDTTLIALGGGVIGDMTGFAAACYQRGVDFIQIPTTVLSQVDSSVGGKTAVNHPLGKNMIGAFYQPKAVLIDIDCLKTLPARELSAGLAEVIKYGIIYDAEFFQWLEQHMADLMALEPKAMTYAIERCCAIKAEIVAKDETEQDVRALLNLGHTFGHAIEAEMGYGNWLHGEAVAAGMVQAAQTALLRGAVSQSELDRIIALLKQANLPVAGPDSMSLDDYLKHMQRDKKVVSGQLRFVLPIGIGDSEVVGDVTTETLEQVLS